MKIYPNARRVRDDDTASGFGYNYSLSHQKKAQNSMTGNTIKRRSNSSVLRTAGTILRIQHRSSCKLWLCFLSSRFITFDIRIT